jgi:hypothetical protein
MSGVGGASGSKGQKSLTGFGLSIAGSSEPKQQSSDAHLESEVEVVLDNADPAVSQPLSEAALLNFTVTYEFVVYQGVCTDRFGKQKHTFHCSVCNDGFCHEWMYPNEAARHAKVSSTHKNAFSASKVAKTMRKSQTK